MHGITDFGIVPPNVFRHRSSLQGVRLLRGCINPGTGTTRFQGFRWALDIVSSNNMVMNMLKMWYCAKNFDYIFPSPPQTSDIT